MSADQKQFLSTKEAGQLVGRSSDYVAKLAREGKISGKRIGRSWVIDENSLRTYFDLHVAQVEVKKEKLSLERQREYKAAQTPQKVIERSIVKVGNRLPISAEAFVGLTISLLVVFGSYSLIHASGIAALPGKLFDSVHEFALSTNRNIVTFLNQPRIAEREDYVVARSVKEETSFGEVRIPNILFVDDRYTYVAPQDIFAATYVPAPPEFDFSLETIGATYLNFGTGVVNLAHGSVDAYTQFVDTLGKESFYSAQMMWGAAQNISDGLVNGYVTGITSFTSIAQTVPTRYETFVYEFVDASFKVATVLGTAPYIVGDQIVTSASVVPQTAHVLGSSVRTGAPTFSQNLGAGYVALIENFVFATYRLTDAYMDAVETAGAQIADVYFLVRFDIPAQAWMSMKGAYEGAVTYAKGEIQEAGDYIARNTTIPVIALVTETTMSIGEVAATQVKVFEDTFENSLSRVQLAQAEGATSFFSRIRSGIENIFGRKPDPVLFVNPGPAQTNVVVREEAPVLQQPRNITQNFYATTDVSKNYVDSSIKALHAALTAQFQSLSQANRNQIVQNIETIQLINRIEDISDTIIRRPEILGGFLRDVEITGSSKFSGTRVRSDEFIGGTANFATTTLSNLTVNGDTTFTGTLTVGGLATTGALTAPYFTATSTTATSTFAGSFAIDTDGFVYATSTGNVGIGVLSPQALLSLRNATNTQAILTLSNAAGTEVGRFTDGGNFGIGTTSPYEKLSVDGNGVFTGTLSAATTTLSGRLTGTDAIFANATITAATTTNFYSSVLRALSSTLTNLIATNATTTNATSTNFYTSVLNAVTGSITNFTATNATSTNLAVSSLTSGRIPYATTGGRLIDSSALTFDGTTFNATDLIATRATTTNATSTNLSISGTLNLSGLTPSRALFLDGNGNVAISGASSLLASSLTDETGTGSVVFSASPTLTGTATLANFTAANGTTTNATSTNLAVSSALRLPNLTASRLVALNTNGALTNSDLASWVAGTSNQITVADDGDGSITLSLPSQLSFTNFTATNGTTTNATSTNLAVTGSISVPADSFGTNEIADVYLLNTGDTATGDYNFDSNTLFIDSGDNRVGIGTNNPLKGLHVQQGGSSGLTSAFGDGLLFSTNSASGARIFLDNLSGGVNQKAAALVNENVNGVGTLYFGALSDNGGSWIHNHLLAMNLLTGNVGIGTSSPYAKLAVVGQAVAEYFTATSTTQASVFPRLTSTYATTTQLAVGSLTSGRIPYATTGGRLVDSSALTFDGTTFNATDLTATRATTTNATSTNLAVSSALRLPSLTASRLVALNANGALTNSDLASWVAGTSNQITVADDGDGSITLSLPSQLSFTNFTATNGTTTNATSTNLAISSLTSGRIPYATTGGRLIDSSSLTFDGSTVTAPRFVASSASATSTFAGGLAVETLGLVYDYQTNNVGIGTASPGRKLDVVGSSALYNFEVGNAGFGASATKQVRIGYDDTNTVGWIQAANFGTAVVPLALQPVAGNVGIGTTTPGTVNTNAKLDIYGGGSSVYPTVSVNTASADAAWRFRDGTNDVYVGVLASSNCGAGFAVYNGGCRLLIDSSGNVGIGTTSPSTKLSVSGTFNVTSGTSFFSNTAWLGTFTDTIGKGVGIGYSPDNNGHAIQGLASGGGYSDLALNIYGGNVGIGTTTPEYTLTIASASGNGSAMLHSGFSGGTSNFVFNNIGDTSTAQLTFQKNFVSKGSIIYSHSATAAAESLSLNAGGGTQELTVLGSGNVGIGTTTPQTGLHFYNESTNAVARIESGASSIAALQLKQVGTTTQWLLESGRQGVNDFNIYQGNGIGTAFTITNAGNVGIGTTTPTQKLAVDGGIVVTGARSVPAFGNGIVIDFGGLGGTNVGAIQGWDYGVPSSRNISLQPVGGNVGVGTTTIDANLTVATASTGDVFSLKRNDNNQTWAINLSGNDFTLKDTTGSISPFTVLNGTGNVGIGTTAPDSKLDLVGSGFPLIINSTDSNGLKLKWEDNGTVAGYIGASTVLGHSFYVGDTNANTQFVVNNSTGNVGINDTSPTEGKLVVNGGSGVGIYASTVRTDVSQGVGHQFSTTFNLSTDIGVYGENHTTSVVVTGGTNATVYGNFSQGYVNISGGATLGSNNVFFARNATAGASPTGAVTGSAVFYIDETSYQHTGTASLTLANNYGLFVGNQGAVTTGVTKTNAYGVYIAAQSGASNNYALYAPGSESSYFAGNVGIGLTNPSYKLQVVGGSIDINDNGSGVRFGAGDAEITHSVYDLLFSTYTGSSLTEKVRITSAGNVGIGTTTPSNQLNIVNNALSGGGIVVRDAYSTGGAGGTIEAIGTRNDGNFSHAFNGGLYLASHRSDSAFDGGNDLTYDNLGVIAFGANHTSGALSNIAYPVSITAVAESNFTSSSAMAAGLSFRTGSTGYAKGVVNQTIGTERLRITSGGSVGIGTSTPTAKLEVKDTSLTTLLRIGNSYAVSGGDTSNVLAEIFTNQTAGNYAGLYVARGGNSGTYLTQIANGLNIGPTANGATTPYIYVGAAAGYEGRIGIGDATPGAKLQVALDNSAFTPGNGWDNKTALFGGTGSSASGFGIAHDTTNGTRLMSIEPGVAWRAIDFAASNYSFGINGVGDSLVINPSGNVGIGTTTPVSTLAVDGTFSVTGASNTGFWISEIAGLTTFLGLNSTATTYNPLSLRSHSQTQLYLDTTGNVGIGTADPDARLDVAAASNGTPSLGSAAYYSQIWQNFSGGYGLGVNVNASTGIVQLQSQRFDATATAYDIALNPLGGKVGISTSTPKAQFHIDAGTSASAGDATLLISGNGNATSNASLVLQSLDDQSGRAMGTFYHSHSTGTEWFAGRSFNASTNFEFGYASTASHSSGTSNTTNRVVAIGNTGLLGVKTLGGATANDLCYDTTTHSGLNTLATCSSSERYKENITNLSLGGLDTVLALRAVEFDWIGTGEHDLGFVAEEVEALNPLLATYKDGVIEGVKYKQLTSVLVSAIQEIVDVIDITNATGTAITINASGNIGIGTTTPAYKVHVLGDVAATSFVNISTREEKKGITYFDEARKETVLDKLETIKIAEYRYEYESDNNPLRLGLIAEEAPQEILAVGGKGVDIYKLATFTLASVQALATRVESLEERVAALEAQGMIPGQSGGVFSTTTLKSAFAELGVLIEKGFAQFDKLAFRQLIAEKDTDGQAAAGTGTILAGNKLVLVENNQISASSKVFITFTSPVVGSWFITDKANGSFRVTLAEVQGADVTFDYFIVQTERPQTPTSNTGVVDTEAPVITLLGANPLYLALKTPFSDPGATVTDNVDQNLEYELFIDGYPAGEYEIDTSTKSEHVLTYKVLDTAGNLTTVTRGVFVGSEATLGSIDTGTSTPPTTTGSTTPATTTPPVVEEEEAPVDTTAPTITLSGKAAMKITVGDTFVDPGATATDDTDGDVTEDIVVTGSVDAAKAGTHTLTYTVEDAAGNVGSASRVVTVQASESAATTTPQQ